MEVRGNGRSSLPDRNDSRNIKPIRSAPGKYMALSKNVSTDRTFFRHSVKTIGYTLDTENTFASSLMQRFLSIMVLTLCAPAYAMGWSSPAPANSGSALAGGADRCEVVLDAFNKSTLGGQIDSAQLSDIVRTLAARKQLPSYFVTKKQARQAGWSPGQYFSDIPALRGKSMGGDHFGNYERRLPKGQWSEADLDYRGKKRNAKRLVFERAGDQYVSVDHYESFHKVPACR